MKLTQLEYFCVAARYHNITRASKELFVTQPSVSNAIKALEEEFGINLFYRNNNKLTLDFHVIVAYGVSILAVSDNLISNVKYKVEEFTGIEIEKINIFVEGVRVID